MATNATGWRYVAGAAPPQQADTATFEFKAPDAGRSGGRGGGYPRWRSWERRPHTSRRGKEDVYVPVHRLTAVAWCFEDGRTAADILDSGELVGVDVHHSMGHPCCTIEGELELRDHGEHSSITQSEKRAWAEDAKDRRDGSDKPDVCPRCGDDLDGDGWTVEGVDGQRCLDCATEYAQHADDATVRPA